MCISVKADWENRDPDADPEPPSRFDQLWVMCLVILITIIAIAQTAGAAVR